MMILEPKQISSMVMLMMFQMMLEHHFYDSLLKILETMNLNIQTPHSLVEVLSMVLNKEILIEGEVCSSNV